jgi:hypothetical protein
MDPRERARAGESWRCGHESTVGTHKGRDLGLDARVREALPGRGHDTVRVRHPPYLKARPRSLPPCPCECDGGVSFQGKDDSARFSSRRRRRDSQICDSSSSPPPPDAWISTFGVDAPFSGASYSEYQRVDDSAARTDTGSVSEGEGRRAISTKMECGRALSRKAGSVSAKAETSECKEHPWCDITVAPCAARASLLSRLRTSERVRQRRCGNHSCGGGGRRGGRPTPEIRFSRRGNRSRRHGRGTHANAFCGITGPEGQN